jgi:protein-S-isoprenylcysteine O-methyltransferase Ste14
MFKQLQVGALIGAAIGAALVLRHGYGFAPTAKPWPVVASIAAFCAFNIYWLAAATNAPAKTMESQRSRQLHEFLMNAGYLLILLPSMIAVPIFSYRFVPPSSLFSILGLALQTAFIGLAIWARRTLGLNWSGRIEIKTEHQLVRSGPYRILRHPIYTAVLGMTISMALVSGKVLALFGVATVIVAYVRKIRIEEETLHNAFGTDYENYRRTSWGLFPGLF